MGALFFKKYLILDALYGRIQIFGGIAQLGERLTGSQEVIGSNPTISTSVPPEPICFSRCKSVICTPKREFGVVRYVPPKRSLAIMQGFFFWFAILILSRGFTFQ